MVRLTNKAQIIFYLLPFIKKKIYISFTRYVNFDTAIVIRTNTLVLAKF